MRRLRSARACSACALPEPERNERLRIARVGLDYACLEGSVSTSQAFDPGAMQRSGRWFRVTCEYSNALVTPGRVATAPLACPNLLKIERPDSLTFHPQSSQRRGCHLAGFGSARRRMIAMMLETAVPDDKPCSQAFTWRCNNGQAPTKKPQPQAVGVCCLVELGGVEPPSANLPYPVLHA